MRTFTTIACLALTVPANAAWRVDTVKDRMTDKAETIISVHARETVRRFGNQVAARLQIECWKSSAGFTPLVSIAFDRPVAVERTGVAWRVNEGAVVNRIIKPNSSGDAFHLELLETRALARQMTNADRLRVTVFWKLDDPAFLEFDLKGGKAAYAKLPCK